MSTSPLLERLPDATVISVGHRPELEAFHTRKLVLEYRADGARLVSDEPLQRTFGRSARLLEDAGPQEIAQTVTTRVLICKFVLAPRHATARTVTTEGTRRKPRFSTNSGMTRQSQTYRWR